MKTLLKKSLFFTFFIAFAAFFTNTSVQALFEDEKAATMIEAGQEDQLNFIQKWMGKRWIKKTRKEAYKLNKKLNKDNRKLEKLHNKSKHSLEKAVDDEIRKCFFAYNKSLETLKKAIKTLSDCQQIKTYVKKTDGGNTKYTTMLKQFNHDIKILEDEINLHRKKVDQYAPAYKKELSILKTDNSDSDLED